MTTMARERFERGHGDAIPALRPGASIYREATAGQGNGLPIGPGVSVVRIASTAPVTFTVDGGSGLNTHLLPGGVEYVRVSDGDTITVVAITDAIFSISEC